MDMPKHAHFLFINFPPDIWSHVVRYVPGDQLGRLKMTGCKLIWRMLCIPQVVKSVKLGSDFVRFKSYPAFLNEFPTLEDLFISKASLWPIDFDALPSSLRKLQFRGNYVEFFSEDDEIPLTFAEHLPNLEYLDVAYLPLNDYSWVAHSPQSLTYLAIGSWDGSVDLPASLLHLAVGTLEIEDCSDLNLPSGLTTLHINDVDDLNWLLSNLPTTLSEFNFSTLGYWENVVVPFEKIPESMISLTLPMMDFGTCDVNSLNEIVSKFPPNLTEFSARCCLPASAWAAFPPNLKKLTFSTGVPIMSSCADADPVEFSSFPIQTLPRSITELEVYGSPGDIWSLPSGNSISSYFPPQLTSLEVIHLHFPAEVARYLPATLVELYLSDISEQVCRHLPNGIKYLSCSSTLMSPNLIKFLPKSLTHLYLTLGSYFTRLNEDEEHHEYLIHQNYGSNIDWKGEYSLPSSLTYLSLNHFSELGDSFVLNQNLPDLMKLSLEHSQHFTDLSIPLLGSHVTDINLSKSSKISGKCFPFLPRGLLSLDLRSSSSIFDSDIQHLPRSLKEANLDSAIHLTDLCVPNFPPHLKKLMLSKNDKISTSSFRDFPYALRSTSMYCPLVLANWQIARGRLEILHY